MRGEASFTAGTVGGGTCSFVNYSLSSGLFATGIGPSNWASGGKCGACLQVNGPRGSVKVMIVDSCPSCQQNRLNLFDDAFRKIGDPTDGIIPVTFDIVSCGITSPLWVRNKVGTSKYFFSMQVLNANFPVTALHVSTDGGNRWEETTRQNYNYFEKEGKGGFGKDRVMVRVSCSNGRQVILPDVSMEEKAETSTPVNC
ncbi:RlpA-like double-psi beta-barrel-protein domain-containing protein-containing protein [Lasiosphaeris hirsuta]|uniref:RlpA-like double-psi beta-barrel-protein domain-containing protein-containing protein n=1 Tax=Lasiosphaeris hirsuta TaxID=260670 RepID=A0AA40B9Q4_9PEZI|nr:RlpA-like double-psi beta-barrel-protein domain-containing protein-containing protein [Lasiosphaeris hirsuta]